MSYFDNGGIIGKLLDYNTSETYASGNKKNSGIWSLQTVWANKGTTGGAGPFIVWNAASVGTDNQITTTDKDIQIGDILFLTSIGSFARDIGTMVDFGTWSELYYRFDWPTISIIYKVVDTTDDFSQVIFGESGIASRVAFCVRGADLAQMSSTNQLIDDASILAVTLDTAGQLNPPSISVPNNSSLIIGIGAHLGTSVDSSNGTPPTGWGKNWGYFLQPGSLDSHSHLGGSVVVNSGTYDPPSWTGASDSWSVQYTLALAPL
jgi:hypothetical protein